MEGEDRHYALTRFDISKPFRVFLIDGKGALHVGDSPVAGKLLGVGTDEADGPQFDVHDKPPCITRDSFAHCGHRVVG